jgi:hypothetical protein
MPDLAHSGVEKGNKGHSAQQAGPHAKVLDQERAEMEKSSQKICLLAFGSRLKKLAATS